MQGKQRKWRISVAVFALSLLAVFVFPGCGKRSAESESGTGDDIGKVVRTDDATTRTAGRTIILNEPDHRTTSAGGRTTKTTMIVSSLKPAAIIGSSVMNEAKAAIDRSLDWLVKHQKKNGSWSDENYPALTALSLWAFANSKHPKREEVINKAVAFILSCVQEDGGIYHKTEGQEGGGLSNYNTAICMTALNATKKREVIRIVQNARKFIAGSQHTGSDVYRGGFGYDRSSGRTYTDGVNTLITLEGMVLTSDVEDLRDKVEGRVDINWKAAREYAERLQNPGDSGKNQKGSFIYSHHEIKGPKAGITTNQAGRVVFRSYGSMTYAGMLMLIYAKVPRDDPRVKSAFDWTTKHWSLEENPGMGAQGLYFFYNVLTKALSAYGQDRIEIQGGKAISWRTEVVKKLLELHKIDPDGTGYWLNATGRFWEANPVLATSYTVLTLQIATGL